MSDGTYSLPPCEPECDLSTWPTYNLIVGVCPRCTRTSDDTKAARMLRAKRLSNSDPGERA